MIGCSGYVPRNVLSVAEPLNTRTDRYIFFSSVSAYADWPALPLTEASPLLEAPADAGPEFDYQKASCEALY